MRGVEGFIFNLNRKQAIHARFFSKERKGDIPWNIDVVLKINGSTIDIQKVSLFSFFKNSFSSFSFFSSCHCH